METKGVSLEDMHGEASCVTTTAERRPDAHTKPA